MTMAITPDDVTRLWGTMVSEYRAVMKYKPASVPGASRCATLGRVVWVPQDWESYTPSDQYILLTHESVHLAQFAKYGLFGFLSRYLLLPLPVGLAAYRYKIECEAYKSEMQAVFTIFGGEHLRALTKHYQNALRGYYWACIVPGAINSWVTNTIESVINENSAE